MALGSMKSVQQVVQFQSPLTDNQQFSFPAASAVQTMKQAASVLSRQTRRPRAAVPHNNRCKKLSVVIPVTQINDLFTHQQQPKEK
jgi:hypothetical protein